MKALLDIAFWTVALALLLSPAGHFVVLALLCWLMNGNKLP